MAVIGEQPPIPFCHNCGADIPLGWRALMGKAKCPKCGAAFPRFHLRKVPWWIVLHFKSDFMTNRP